MTLAQILYIVVFAIWNAASLVITHPGIIAGNPTVVISAINFWLPVIKLAHHILFSYCVFEFIIKHKDNYM